MNDLERDLRTLLDERASTAGTPVPDARLVRRARRRQVGTALTGALAAAALVGGVALAMWAFGPSREGMPADRLEPLVDTTVNGVAVTHPGAGMSSTRSRPASNPRPRRPPGSSC
jgi:hypothetical protein